MPANVAWQRATQTDTDGRFAVADVPRGRVRVIVVADKHRRYEFVADVEAGQRARLELFPEPLDPSSYRTVVQTRPRPSDAPPSEILTKEEIRTLPGTQGDPLRALQNLPGVARAPGGLGLLVVRGAAPGESRVYLGGHALPRAFHLLSLASVFPAEVMDSLEYVPGNFDAIYGNAAGGIVIVEPRTPRRDGFHGYGEIDLAAAGALVEGPVGRGSFAVGAQRGYVDGVLAVADSVIERTTGDESGFLRPRYYDYQGVFDYPVAGGSVQVRLLGAGDRLRATQSELDYRDNFHRADIDYRVREGRWRLRLTPSVRYDAARFSSSTASTERRRQDLFLSVRLQAGVDLTKRFTFITGTDVELDAYWTRDNVSQEFGGPSISESTRGTLANVGAYSLANLRFGRTTLRPGVRANAFTEGDQTAFAFDPRFVGHVDVTDAWRLSAGLGRYSMARTQFQTSGISLLASGSDIGDGSVFFPRVFARLNPTNQFQPVDANLGVRSALHASVGGRYQFSDGYSVGLTGFLKEQNNGVPVFLDGQLIRFAGLTRVFGLEFIARKRLTRNLYGWVAYTLLSARVRLDDPSSQDTPDGFPSDFDQRHNLVAVLSYSLPRNWRIGGRFRLVSGYPFTPVIGSVAREGGFQAIFGDTNSARLPPFTQLDLRVDKRWFLKRASVNAYVDVQNVANVQTPEAILYTADFRGETTTVGLPIFPSFGVRVDY